MAFGIPAGFNVPSCYPNSFGTMMLNSGKVKILNLIKIFSFRCTPKVLIRTEKKEEKDKGNKVVQET
jgi:hypothetical protein